jgi:peptidoglycan/LPS O-acetylase OafA/YrhL
MDIRTLPPAPLQQIGKDAPLEAARGIAALSVVTWHLLLGFFPQYAGIFRGFDPSRSIGDRFWSGFATSGGAVPFFFVLSGLVLTRRALARRDPTGPIRSAIKRWPRLAVPVTGAVLLSWAAFALGIYSFKDAGAITGSDWLANFANGYEGDGFAPRFFDAVFQKTVGTFWLGDSTHNSSLCTMKFEFAGSFMVLGLALVLIAAARFAWLQWALLLVCAALVTRFSAFYLAMMAGLAMALILSVRRITMPPTVAAFAVIRGYYLFGFRKGFKDCGWLGSVIGHQGVATYVWIVAACLVVAAMTTSPAIRNALSGRLALAIGRAAFPIYLLHVPVLCSAGTFVFLALHGISPSPWPEIAAALTTVAVTLLLAAPLAIFDTRWGNILNRRVARLLPSRSQYNPAASPVGGAVAAASPVPHMQAEALK